MFSKSLFLNFKILRSRIILLVIIIECSKKHLANGAIIISKREKFHTPHRIKNYCFVPEQDQYNENLIMTNSLKINCSQVPGPIIKLDIGDDSFLQLDSGPFIAPGGFCALQGNPNYGKICPFHSNPLLRKCCDQNEILDSTSFTCRPSRIKFRPQVANSIPQSFVVANNSYMAKGGRISFDVKLHCPNNLVPKIYSSNPCLPDSSGIFKLAANGTPMYEASSGVFLRKTQLRSVEHDSYCIDGILDFSSSPCTVLRGNDNQGTGNGYDGDLDDNNGDSCESVEMREILFVCVEETDTILNEDGNDDVPKAYFFAALWLSTCPLLLSSAIVNSFVIQRNVHGWILTSYLVSMFLVNINSVILILDIQVPASPHTEGGCGVLDFTMKFIYLSSLCWMSSMCMNMMRTFSSTVPHVAIAPHRFLLSALFSLGFPIVAVSVSYYVGSLPENEPLFSHNREVDENNTEDIDANTPPPLLQACRKGTCALYSYKTLPYYSGPIIFLVLCNVVAFVKTSTTIASLRRQAEAVLHKQTRDHLESFTLFAKLFLLTGSIWVIRVALLVLQIQGLYVTWYGVALEAVFSIPEVVFPMIIFHHPEFIKWASGKSPMISRIIVKCSPFCKKDLVFRDHVTSPEFQSANQMSCGSQGHSVNHQYSGAAHGFDHVAVTSDPIPATISETAATTSASTSVEISTTL